MLTCSACVHTCIRSILSDVLSIPAPLQFGRSANRRASQHRQISTSNFHSNAVPRAEARSIVRHARNSRVSDKATPRHVAVNPRQKPTEVKEVKKNHIRRELTYLSDPLKLADLAWKILQQDNQAKALDMVRMASRNMACTVSWNHIIDYEMSKGRVNNAVKIYNEVHTFHPLPETCSQQQSLTCPPPTDEEARPNPRLLHLHAAPTRLRQPHRLPKHARARPVHLPLHVRRELTLQTHHHAHQRRPQSLRPQTRPRRPLRHRRQTAPDGPTGPQRLDLHHHPQRHPPRRLDRWREATLPDHRADDRSQAAGDHAGAQDVGGYYREVGKG